ncbi:MAG: ATP synthase F1 subunit delta [Pirellulales bacterium]|jgi:F-type H+-transporting ATPase subunit delta
MSNTSPSHDHNANTLDPSAGKVARVYAQAILEAAERKGCLSEVLEELRALGTDVLPKVPKARFVFDSPRVPLEEKTALIDRLTAGRMLPTTTHALHVLARHGRLGILAEVADAAAKLADELAGRREALLTTAVALSADEQQKVVADVEQKLGVSLSARFSVDPALIGGLVVRVGDTVYDQSIASGLASLGGKLHRRTINEIQHGRDRLTSA